MQVCKLRSEKSGKHVRTAVFMGEEGCTLANCGTLVQDIGEWQVFGAALLLGADQMKSHFRVITEGDKQVVGIE